MSYSRLGDVLMRAREQAGLSISELAVLADFPINRLMQLESGWLRPFENELERLAEHLPLDVAELKRLAEAEGPGLA